MSELLNIKHDGLLVKELPSLTNMDCMTSTQVVCSDGVVYGNALLLSMWSGVIRSFLESTDGKQNDYVVIAPGICTKTIQKILAWSLHGVVAEMTHQEAKEIAVVLHLMGASVDFSLELVNDSRENPRDPKQRFSEREKTHAPDSSDFYDLGTDIERRQEVQTELSKSSQDYACNDQHVVESDDSSFRQDEEDLEDVSSNQSQNLEVGTLANNESSPVHINQGIGNVPDEETSTAEAVLSNPPLDFLNEKAIERHRPQRKRTAKDRCNPCRHPVNNARKTENLTGNELLIDGLDSQLASMQPFVKITRLRRQDIEKYVPQSLGQKFSDKTLILQTSASRDDEVSGSCLKPVVPPSLKKRGDKGTLLSCPLCGSSGFKDICGLKIHLVAKHYKQQLRDALDLDGDFLSGAWCNKCKKSIVKRSDKPERREFKMLRHFGCVHHGLEKVMPEKFAQLLQRSYDLSCPLCNNGKSFNYLSLLKSHLCRRHFRKQILEAAGVSGNYDLCPLCKERRGGSSDHVHAKRLNMANHLGRSHGYLMQIVSKDIRKKLEALEQENKRCKSTQSKA